MEGLVPALAAAENCLDEVIERDPGCAEAWHYLVVLGRARQLPMEERRRRFGKLIEIGPTHLFGHEQMLNNVMAKWSGSHEAMFDFARTRAAAHPGTDIQLLVAQAHLEYWRAEKTAGYLNRGEVAGEIYAAARNSLWHPGYRRSLLTPVLWNHFAYCLSLGSFHREACEIYDQIGDEWIRTAPWNGVKRYARSRDRADDPGPLAYDNLDD